LERVAQRSRSIGIDGHRSRQPNSSTFVNAAGEPVLELRHPREVQ
jgi:hypothetical protein